MSNYYTKSELINFGFSNIGSDVKVSRNSSLYSVSGSIGSGTRIDDFVILKGEFVIGRKVHICSHSSLSAVAGRITIGDLTGVGVSNIFYTGSDDMLQSGLCGPLVDKKYTRVKTGDIFIDKAVALGGRVTVMPDSSVGCFTAVGIGALVTGKLESFSVYATIAGRLKKVGKRDSQTLLSFAKESLG